MVYNLFFALVTGSIWGSFVFQSSDLWHGQGHYFQVLLLLIFCASFFEKPRCVQAVNKPLGLLTLWLGSTTAYWWYVIFVQVNQYSIKIMLPFFNYLCFIWFYRLSIEYMDRDRIDKVLRWLSYSVIGMLFYCVLQYFKLDEFLLGYDGKDQLVGTLGNSSHLAGYLAIVQPIFFKRNLYSYLAITLLWIVIILCNSAAGVIVGVLVILYWLFLRRYYRSLVAFSVVLGGISALFWVKIALFFSFSHRIELWKLMFIDLKNKAITGFGLGTFGAMKYNLMQPQSHWRHMHNEYLQVVFEAGIIGLILVLWVIHSYFQDAWKLRNNHTSVILNTMFFGFCLLSLFSFPAHLPTFVIIGALSYSWQYAFKQEV